ncbi:L,D-transpeptidase family protein [Qipengyuania sp. 6B39]|uniref:L,D-transpeptidase family protein n=1 Tax=Qipengyuania proteolytica TaxID=2867239 RepID=UPI001C8A9A42|nr:L,D-transpeptidase family protein [Qipengyuania proteolytica]MBX7495917.1 L,D-transpeptidase family protein [Qipengyuania proteolytica]
MRHLIATASLFALAACGLNGTDNEEPASDTVATADAGADYGYETYGEDNLADSMASNDGASSAPDAIADPEERPIMQAQVVLDRIGFGPGVIDGKMGMSTENALRGFQEANNLDITGTLDDATKQALSEWQRIPATRVVTIPASWSDADYTDMPDDVAEQAKLERLGYATLDERLAERFHTTVAVLKMLNPDGKPAGFQADGTPDTKPSATPDVAKEDAQKAAFFHAGQQIRVPNIGADRIAPGSVDDTSWQQTLASLGVGTDQPAVDRIVVSKAGKTLKAYRGDKLIALFTVSSGSSEFPLPLGEWKILGEAYNPPYSYDPEVLGKNAGKTYKLAPGPNSPVGVVWIDLSKEHYGIHGTPDPETIGRAQSSGCVRLTNWDAARLAGMVSQSTEVIFEA